MPMRRLEATVSTRPPKRREPATRAGPRRREETVRQFVALYLNCGIALSWSLVALSTPWSGYQRSAGAVVVVVVVVVVFVLLTLRVLVGAVVVVDDVRTGSFTNLILDGSTRMSC